MAILTIVRKYCTHSRALPTLHPNSCGDFFSQLRLVRLSFTFTIRYGIFLGASRPAGAWISDMHCTKSGNFQLYFTWSSITKNAKAYNAFNFQHFRWPKIRSYQFLFLFFRLLYSVYTYTHTDGDKINKT